MFDILRYVLLSHDVIVRVQLLHFNSRLTVLLHNHFFVALTLFFVFGFAVGGFGGGSVDLAAFSEGSYAGGSLPFLGADELAFLLAYGGGEILTGHGGIH